MHDLTYTFFPRGTTESALNFLGVFFDRVLLLKSKITKKKALTCGNYRSTTDKEIHLWFPDWIQEDEN